MVTVQDIMNSKVVTIKPDASLHSAIERLLAEDVSSLMVVDGNSRIIGILNEEALVAATFDGQIRNNSVSLHMDRQFTEIQPDAAIEQVIDLSILHRVRQIPVVKNGQLVGVVSRRHVLQAVFGDSTLATVI